MRTAEQEMILGAELNSGQCIIIQAGAGCGKSTTLREIALKHPEKRFLNLVFNKDAQRDAEAKATQHRLRNMDCRTVHSLCYDKAYIGTPWPYTGSGLGKYFKNKGEKIDKKFIAILRALLTKFIQSDLLKIDRELVADDYWFRHYENDECVGYAGPSGVVPLDPQELEDIKVETVAYLRELFAASIDPQNKLIPLPFDGWIKIQHLLAYKNGNAKGLFSGYDVVMVDEAQDQTPPFSAILELNIKVGGPCVVLVGDPRQAIYEFRGAINTIESLSAKIKNGTIKGQIFGLMTSFRFGHSVAKLANRVLDFGTKQPDFPIKGVDEPNQLKGEAYLSRTNSRLFKLLAETLEDRPNVKIYLAGTTESEHWSPRKKYNFSVIEDLHHFKANCDSGKNWAGRITEEGKFTTPNSLLQSFGNWRRLSHAMQQVGKSKGQHLDLPEELITDDMTEDQKLLAKELNESTLDLSDAGEVKAFYDFYCQHGVSILNRIEDACVGPNEADISFSTSHKAKGLEWARVHLLGDFPIFKHPWKLMTGDLSQGEIDLFYMATTRGQVVTYNGNPIDLDAMIEVERQKMKDNGYRTDSEEQWREFFESTGSNKWAMAA